MAATKITDLSATTTLGANDLFVVVTNPSNAPATKKVKAGDVVSSLANIAVAPATTNTYGTVKVGDNLYLNGNGALSANIQNIQVANSTVAGVVSIRESGGLYVDANGALSANTGNIVTVDSVVSTNAESDIVVTSNNNYGITVVSNNYVQMVYSEDGSYWGGGDNQSYVYVDSGGVYNSSYRFVDPLYYWSESNLDPYGSLNVYGWNGSYSYNYTFETTNASTLAIKPSPYFNNRLAIEPTMDYDIHIYEVNTRAGILVGKPQESFIAVYGPGGNNAGEGLGGNNVFIRAVGDSPVSIGTASNTHIWNFNSNGAIEFPYQPSNARTGSGQTLLIGNNSSQIIIAGAPTNSDSPTAQRLVIAGADGTDSGEGGDIYLWAGRSGWNGGSGGDIKVDAGNGLAGSEGGTIKIRGGNSDTGQGGFVEIWSGSGNTGAPITLHTHTGSYWNQWTYGTDGKIVLPSNGDIVDTDGSSPLRDIPQTIHTISSDYVLQMSDRGKHVLVEQNYAVLVPDNGTTPFPKGTAIVIVSDNNNVGILPSTGSNTVIYNNGTQVFSNSSVDQGFYISPYTMATLLKVNDDTWIVSAPNLQTGW